MKEHSLIPVPAVRGSNPAVSGLLSGKRWQLDLSRVLFGDGVLSVSVSTVKNRFFHIFPSPGVSPFLTVILTVKLARLGVNKKHPSVEK